MVSQVRNVCSLALGNFFCLFDNFLFSISIDVSL